MTWKPSRVMINQYFKRAQEKVKSQDKPQALKDLENKQGTELDRQINKIFTRNLEKP